jgi:tetratricopeptide (TPR) repeat protein
MNYGPTMQSFSSALGVHCNYCHDDSKGSDFRDIDFASDSKPTKKAAQVMLTMVESINGNNLKDAQKFKADIGTVQCVTCHRGSANIDMLEDILFSTYKKGGYDATLKKYEELRQKYYGGFTYDFRDHTLLSLATKINDSGNIDDAVKVVNKDIELFPESSSPLVFLGNIYMKSGNNEEAEKYLKRALIIDPNNRFVDDMLKRLKNSEKK